MTDDLRNNPEEYWKKKLTPEEYHFLREGGTEPPFANEYVDNHEDGMYHCKACGEPLFSSDTKFESESGWPSFYDAVDREKLELLEDNSFAMRRTEVLCANCGSHLGHLFPDGPKTGLRYCLNSACLAFEPHSPIIPTKTF